MQPSYLCRDNYHLAFIELSELLLRYEHLWRCRPFIDDGVAWQNEYPQLYQALMSVDDLTLDSLGDEASLIELVTGLLPEAEALRRWQVAPYEGVVEPMAKFADVGIPGRKIEQITRFAAVFKQHVSGNEAYILDWCSGKGHLAKQLHFVTGAQVTCLEYNGQLCQSGEREARKLDYPIRFVEQNVLQPIEPSALNDAKVHTALHACGDLHLAMMACAVENDAEHLVLSPCCYHLTEQAVYQKLSTQAKACTLELDPKDLRLAVSQMVTAGERVRRLRKQELTWRIGFDLLQRRITGKDQYRPTESIQKKWMSGSFTEFCHLMAERIGLSLPDEIEQEELLTQAQVKYARITRAEKARLAFRPAMELYLVLDRVLYLQQQGYEVTLKTFVDAKVTPRNIMIIASRDP